MNSIISLSKLSKDKPLLFILEFLNSLYRSLPSAKCGKQYGVRQYNFGVNFKLKVSITNLNSISSSVSSFPKVS